MRYSERFGLDMQCRKHAHSESRHLSQPRPVISFQVTLFHTVHTISIADDVYEHWATIPRGELPKVRVKEGTMS